MIDGYHISTVIEGADGTFDVDFYHRPGWKNPAGSPADWTAIATGRARGVFVEIGASLDEVRCRLRTTLGEPVRVETEEDRELREWFERAMGL